jgi:hypothetical protein
VLENKCHIHDEDATRIFQASLADFGGDIDVLLWMSRNQHHSVVIFEYEYYIIYIYIIYYMKHQLKENL